MLNFQNSSTPRGLSSALGIGAAVLGVAAYFTCPTWRSVIAVGLALLAALCAALPLLRHARIVRAARTIQGFAEAVARGEYKAALPEDFRSELNGLAGSIMDMVAALKDKLSLYQGVLTGYVVPCVVFRNNTGELRVAYINQQMIDAVGYARNPEECLGLTPAELSGSKTANQETLAHRVARERRTMRAESEFVTRSGQKKIFGITSTPFNDLDGNLAGVIAVWFDLTEIRAQQEQIVQQNERIASAANAANAVSDQVASAAEELAVQIEQANRGSEEQRSRTTETAAAMEELNSTVAEVAKNANISADLAEQAKRKAQHGAELVGQVVGTINDVTTQAQELGGDMTRLGAQAEGIGQIMNVISDIADQTNLLALNAAIEAARAGDAGRGFAVVADEVRKLAEKTMAATNEVGGHIRTVQESARKSLRNTEATTQAILASTDLAQKSGEALHEIVGMVDATADHVRGIAIASKQQTAASEEIRRSTDDIHRIAGETANAMNQSRQAVNDLAQLAQELRSSILAMRAS
jgi:methyl-accepting chemotaxis protein